MKNLNNKIENFVFTLPVILSFKMERENLKKHDLFFYILFDITFVGRDEIHNRKRLGGIR